MSQLVRTHPDSIMDFCNSTSGVAGTVFSPDPRLVRKDHRGLESVQKIKVLQMAHSGDYILFEYLNIGAAK